jgi:ribosomal protein L20
VVNSIIKIILWARRINNEFKSELILYTTFMDNLKINMNVQYDMRDYLEHHYLEEKQRVITIED